MLKRPNMNITGPETKRLKIIRVSQKSIGDVTANSCFDTSRFVDGYVESLAFSTKSTDDTCRNGRDEGGSSAGLTDAVEGMEDVPSNIFDATKNVCFSNGQDLVVELDCETVEMINENEVSVDSVNETFSSSTAAAFCLSDEVHQDHHQEDEEENKNESNPFMAHFEGGASEALELLSNGVVFADGVIKVELPDIPDSFQSESCLDDGFIEQAMDITEPLSTLKRLLESKVGYSLEVHEIWLQDSLQLDQDKNLVSQCLEGTGVVQINVEIKNVEGHENPRLNIVDVLKPIDEEEEVVHDDNSSGGDHQMNEATNGEINNPASASPTSSTTQIASTTCVTKWVVDSWFCNEQTRLKIPRDPALWSNNQVKFWLRWAVKKFKLESVKGSLLDNIDGGQLINLTHDTFTQIFPLDPGDVFWTHLELLRKCKFVAVMHSEETLATALGNNNNVFSTSAASRSNKSSNKTRNIRLTLNSSDKPSSNRFGNNGQIQLWQFLLELLTDKDYRDYIQWVGSNGEFKLVNPEYIAQLWGQRKNKTNMNYEKLSRALRYYYDGDMIAKVHGKRFTYKYVCDLRTLLGYSAAELNQLVNECAERWSTQQQGGTYLQTHML